MARPLVIVFQELVAPTATPTIPDLNTVIVGPAYDLLDYPDDAVSIQLADAYGALDQPVNTYVPPATGEDAITVLDGAYPQQSPGAHVDHDSVAVYLKYPRVVLGSTNAAVQPIGTSVTTSTGDLTLITLTGSGNFVDAGIRAGDLVILTSSASETLTRIVASVGEPNSVGQATNDMVLRVTQSLPSTGGWTFNASGEIRIERQLLIQQLVDSAHSIITFPEPGTDKLVINGGITLSVTILPLQMVGGAVPTATTVSRPLSYSVLYLAYRALRANLQEVLSFDNSSLITVNGVPNVNGLGKIDARNPLAVGISVALQNSGTAPIYAYGVPTDDLVGHASARESMSTRRDLYCFVPLTQDIDIIHDYKDEFDSLADPNSALDNGVVQKFRIVVGSVPLPVSTTISEGSISGNSAQPGGASTGLYRTLSIDSSSTPVLPNSLDVSLALAGDTLIIGITDAGTYWQTRRGRHLIAHVNDSIGVGTDSVIEVTPGSARWQDDYGSAVGGTLDSIEFRIVGRDGSTKAENLAEASITNGGGTLRYRMINPTLVGGPYTIEHVSTPGALSVTLVGFAVLVSFPAGTTQAAVVAAVAAHPVVSTLMVATSTLGSAAVAAAGPEDIIPQAGTCVASIVVNDALFNRLNDVTAAFITSGVKAGDTIEFPLDPNLYTPSAFEGRLLTFTVASVLTENSLLIANGVDDTATVGNELPHYFSRDLPGRFLDSDTGVTAMNYRIRRRLTKALQISALATVSQSVRSKRCTLTWPDQVQVSDLRNGALARSTASIRTLAGWVPGYYIGCQVGGACAGLPPQHGLTNLGMGGISLLQHSQGYFTERELTQISDSGYFLMTQATPSALPVCIHQLTTDFAFLETGELSVVKNVDFVSKFFLDLLEPFIGVYNVTEATQNTIFRVVNDGADNLKGRSLARIGPPLISGEVTSLKVSEFDASRIEIYFQGVIPRPLNTIAFHLVV